LILYFLSLLNTLLNGISNIVSLSYYDYKTTFNIIFLAVVFVVLTALLYFLWRKSDGIVKLLAGNVDEQNITITLSNTGLMSVVLRITGVVLLVSNIPRLLGTLVYYAYEGFGGNGSFMASEMRQWVIIGVSCLLGLWLAFGAKWFAGVLKSIWNAGTKPPGDDDGEAPPPEA
jgi:hypothetical protein